MFYLFLCGIFIIFLILLPKNKIINYHYFIVARNNQAIIEWKVRSIYILSRFQGKLRKITAIDLGSTDDTLAILSRLTYPRGIINEVIPLNNNPDKNLKKMITESRQNGEKPIVIFLNKEDESTINKNLNTLTL